MIRAAVWVGLSVYSVQDWER